MSPIKLVFLVLVIAWLTFWLWWRDDPELVGDHDEDARTGKASWYGEGYRGKRMANGERFDPHALTCASYAYPLGTWLYVEFQGRNVVVQVTDRGPALALNRLIDLSEAAFAKIANTRLGVITVRVTVCVPTEPAPKGKAVAP